MVAPLPGGFDISCQFVDVMSATMGMQGWLGPLLVLTCTCPTAWMLICFVV
jgi:hypothetical protein